MWTARREGLPLHRFFQSCLYNTNYICLYNTNFMRSRKLFTRKKAKNGEGRQAVIKHLLLPEEVITELRMFKDAYSVCLSRDKDKWGNPIPIQVTWEQMFRRWMDNVGRFDRDVKDYVETGKAHLAANPPVPVYPVNPTEGEIWEMRHYFERDGEKLDAIPGDLTPFYAVKDGRRVGMKQLCADGWVLMNDAGIEIDYDQAAEVSRILKEHRGQETRKRQDVLDAVEQMRKARAEAGLPEMTLEEINAEIAAARKERASSKSSS